MAICSFCNHHNPDRRRHCEKCGAELAGAAPEERDAAGTDSGLDAQIAELLRQGQKIEAIKCYREATGVGLREAKDAVEARAAELGIVASPMGRGCFAVLAMTLTAASMLVVVMIAVR